MTAAQIDGLIARGEKDGHLPSEIEKMAGELYQEGQLGIKLERVRQIEAVALERLSLDREPQELHERAA